MPPVRLSPIDEGVKTIAPKQERTNTTMPGRNAPDVQGWAGECRRVEFGRPLERPDGCGNGEAGSVRSPDSFIRAGRPTCWAWACGRRPSLATWEYGTPFSGPVAGRRGTLSSHGCARQANRTGNAHFTQRPLVTERAATRIARSSTSERRRSPLFDPAALVQERCSDE